MRNAYADKVGFVADLAYKTQRLVEESATQDGLGRLTKSVTFDVKTLEALRARKGSDEGKVFNLVRGLQKEIDDDANAAPVLQPLKDRAERILKDLENRNTTGLAAMDLLAALPPRRTPRQRPRRTPDFRPKPSAYSGRSRTMKPSRRRRSPMDLAKEAEKLMTRFPNAQVNADELRQLRAALYRPLLAVERDARSKIVD